jgi:hypothetical protein
MLRRWFVAALVIALSSSLFVSQAKAQTSRASLVASLLTVSDVNTALTAVGSGQTVTDSAEVPIDAPPLVSAARIFKTDQGIAVIWLFANADGSAITSTEQNGVLSGQFLKIAADGVFSSVSDFTLAGSSGAADADQIASFSGNVQGTDMNIVADSFIKGDAFGIVLYGTPNDADGTIVGGMLGLQIGKLS